MQSDLTPIRHLCAPGNRLKSFPYHLTYDMKRTINVVRIKVKTYPLPVGILSGFISPVFRPPKSNSIDAAE